jgi:hypothetical protein
MRASILPCIFLGALLTACVDTTAVKQFAQTAPSAADMQSAAGSYEESLTDTANYDVLHYLDQSQIAALESQRQVQVKLIVANASAISQYMSELGAVAGLDTAVSAKANNDLKTGLTKIVASGKVTAPEVAAAEALVDFVGGMIEAGLQQYSLKTAIGNQNTNFQAAVQAELVILSSFEESGKSAAVMLSGLDYMTPALAMKTASCPKAASRQGIASRFPGDGCAQAYAALLTFRPWYAAQVAQIASNNALATKLKSAFENIGKAHQKLYDRRDDLLTQATWNAIKPNVEQAQAALSSVKKL